MTTVWVRDEDGRIADYFMELALVCMEAGDVELGGEFVAAASALQAAPGGARIEELLAGVIGGRRRRRTRARR